MSVSQLFSAVATAGPTYGNWLRIPDGAGSFTVQAYETTGASTCTATVVIQCCNDTGVYPITLATVSLAGTATSAASDGFAAVAPWKYLRGGVTAIAGSTAAVSALINFSNPIA